MMVLRNGMKRLESPSAASVPSTVASTVAHTATMMLFLIERIHSSEVKNS